jgi:undecaprenyl-diphosphatase
LPASPRQRCSFAVLFLLVRLQWAPLESVDHRAAAWLNSLVTGAGELTLDPVLKALVGRLRPVVAHLIAHGNGDSFPSGHSLGITWLGITAFAFELSRQAAGAPVTEGLEPEARTDLKPAEPETTMDHDRARKAGRIAAGVVGMWVLIAGALTGIGKLIMITHNGNGNLLGDHAIPHWFAAHRTSALNHWSLIASNLGATQDILIVSAATCVVFLAVTRHWRPVIFVAVVMFGELGAFLTIAAVVKRPRPDVPHLDSNLPTSAFPSGHMAATTCLYAGLAILVIGHARGWWRYLFLIPAIVMPVMIALARMYRGEHHPTDILASLLFAALWLTAATMLIKPAADGPYRGGRLPHREDAGRSRRAASGSLAKASAAGPASTSASEQRRTG